MALERSYPLPACYIKSYFITVEVLGSANRELGANVSLMGKRIPGNIRSLETTIREEADAWLTTRTK
jgi:hypothetical protein